MEDNELTGLSHGLYINTLLFEEVTDLIRGMGVNDIETFLTPLQTNLQERDDRILPILAGLIDEADMVVGL
jgi:hypothetical protein